MVADGPVNTRPRAWSLCELWNLLILKTITCFESDRVPMGERAAVTVGVGSMGFRYGNVSRKHLTSARSYRARKEVRVSGHGRRK